MRLPKGLIGVAALAMLTLYAILVAIETEGWETPYLTLFSLIGPWVAVGALAFLTFLALVFTLTNRRKRVIPAKPAPPLPPVEPPPPARKAAADAPVVSPERIARALRGTPAALAKLPEEQPSAAATDPAEPGEKPAPTAKPAKPPQKLLPSRSKDRVSVRLVPQVPIIEAENSAGWLAGGARLPPGMAWPAIEGEALQLLAQIDCTQLPPGLWGGLGPRQGWLAIFLGPRSYRPHVLHFPEAGVLQPAPAMPHGSYILGPGAVPAFPRWPVDLVPAPAGQEEPRQAGQGDGMQRLLAQPWDVTEPRFLPFDWPSAQRMMLLAAGMAETSPPAPGAGQPPDMAMLKKIRTLKAAVDTMAASVPFSGAVIDLILTEMRSMVAASPPAAEGAAPAERPFTTHDPAAPGWPRDYVLYLQERTKHIYVEDPQGPPPDFLADCEAFWKELAGEGVASMGHLPWARPRDFDENHDITLLELPSSDLMNWRFGSGKNLVLTMKTAHLASSKFGAVEVHVI